MMDTGECDCGSVAVRDAAAQWFVRLQDGPLRADERQRFQAWCAEHPQHQDEFDLLQGVWRATELVPKDRLRALCAPPVAPPRRRALGHYALAASVVALAVGLGLFSAVQPPTYDATFSTAMGEHRQFALPDGSLIELNARSAIVVRFDQGRRAVELTQGEALFSVEHDASRPFVVKAGAGQVTVTGTRFDVRREDEQTRVVVESGTVKVQGHAAPQGVTLTAGRGTLIDGEGRVAQAHAVNLQALTAWRNGKLVFNDAPLVEVAREVSRYREQPLRVSSAARHLRLSSVFNANDTDALLKALPQILPVSLRDLPDGSQEIIAR